MLAIRNLNVYRLTSIVSGVLLFLFCLSGRFTTERLGIGDYEVRFIFAALCAFWAVFLLAYKGASKRAVSAVFIVLIFSVVCTLSAFSNQSGLLVVNKIIDVWLLFLLVFCAWVFFSGDKPAVNCFLFLMALAGLLYSALVMLSVGDAARGSTGVSGSNVATRIIFMGMISVIYFAEVSGNRAYYMIVPVFLAAIIGVGSRGGMVSALVVLLLYASYSSFLDLFSKDGFFRGAYKVLKKSFVFIVLALGFLVAFFPLVKDVFEKRVVALLVNRLHFAGRDELYLRSVEAIQDNALFGLGLGGYESIGISNYPHNLILELLLDGGIFLGWIFFVFIYLAISVVIRGQGKILTFVCGYMLCVQMFSGDYYDFRFYFVYLVIALMLCTRANEVGGYTSRRMPL